MTTTTPKPREGQVAGFPKEQAVMLTESNAYRAKSIRRTGTDEAPVLFHFRKRCMGMHSYVHTIEAADGTEREIRPSDFKDWEITGCRYPGYLEDLYGSACSAYRWNSFDPEERAQTDICRHEEQLCADLTGTELCTRDFVGCANPTKYGYKPAGGGTTDVYMLKRRGLPVSCANISCGYYEPHTDREYTILEDLHKCYRFVRHIVIAHKTVSIHSPEAEQYPFPGYYELFGIGGYSEEEYQRMLGRFKSGCSRKLLKKDFI